MSLKTQLRQQGFDLIEGPIRDQKLLQLWLKKLNNEVEPFAEKIQDHFSSSIGLTEHINPALDINSTLQDEYSFHIGLSIIEPMLHFLGITNANISGKIKQGKSIRISYDNALVHECLRGELESFLFQSDFKSTNPQLLRHANQNNLILISGILLAKNIVVHIESTADIDADIMTNLAAVGEGKLLFELVKKNEVKMISQGQSHFPIAIKAHLLDFDKGHFQKLTLISDNRNLF